MAGAILDILLGKDTKTKILAPQEGTNVTAIRDNLGDGPVRPGFQGLADWVSYLYNSVILGTRTLGALWVSKTPEQSSTQPAGSARIDSTLAVGDKITGGSDCNLAGDLNATNVNAKTNVTGTFATFVIWVQGKILLMAGDIAVSGTAELRSSDLRFTGTNLSGANSPRGVVARNTLSANSIMHYHGRIGIQGGAVVKQVGKGAWSATTIAVGGPDPTRVRITMDGMDDSDYTVTWTIFGQPGAWGTVMGKVCLDTISKTVLDFTFWDLQSPFALTQIDVTKVGTFEFSFSVTGNQSS